MMDSVSNDPQQLIRLEHAINQMIDMIHQLRIDNETLRQELASSTKKNKHLQDRTKTTIERIKAVMSDISRHKEKIKG